MAQSKPKSNSVVTTQWAGHVLTINVLGAGEIKFNALEASSANREAAEKHGWVQRLCDRAAKSAPKREVGMSDAAWAVVKLRHTQEKHDAIRELADYYMSGDVPWKMTGGGSSGDGGMLLTALCRLRPDRTVEQISGFIGSRTPEQLRAVKARKDVIEQMNKIRLERAGEQDTSGALDDLDSWEEEGTESDDTNDAE